MLRKDQILQKALELFNEKGYVEAGVREIAVALQISPGNLSYHFSKKEDILLVLLQQFSEQNDKLYKNYFSKPPSNFGFLELIHKIFSSQYSFRGVYIGNQFIQKEINEQDQFNYQSISSKREAAFKRIFEDLKNAGYITVKDEDIKFLISFMTLFGRFWISEATLFNKSPDQEQAIKRYLVLITKQLSLFATEDGILSIEKFIKEIL